MSSSSKNKGKSFEYLVLGLFISVPFGSSVISAIHLYVFLTLGNLPEYSIASSIIYEVCSIATLYAIVILARLNAFYVWASFGVVTFLQIIGNIYYSFDYIQRKMNLASDYIVNFTKMLNFVYPMENPDDIAMILAIIIGLPVPMLSIFLTKSLTEYIRKRNMEKELEKIPEVEDKKIEPEKIEPTKLEPEKTELEPEVDKIADSTKLSDLMDSVNTLKHELQSDKPISEMDTKKLEVPDSEIQVLDLGDFVKKNGQAIVEKLSEEEIKYREKRDKINERNRNKRKTKKDQEEKDSIQQSDIPELKLINPDKDPFSNGFKVIV